MKNSACGTGLSGILTRPGASVVAPPYYAVIVLAPVPGVGNALLSKLVQAQGGSKVQHPHSTEGPTQTARKA